MHPYFIVTDLIIWLPNAQITVEEKANVLKRKKKLKK